MTSDQHTQDNFEYGLGTLLRLPYQAMLASGVEPALAAAGFADIRGAHLPVFQSLAKNPAGMRSTDLAAYARITKQSMGSLVDHLQAGGYVERVSDTTDQRAKVVRLTERGWAASNSIRGAVRDVEVEWEQHIGAARLAELRAILRELVTMLDQ
jgi:DNA-binding MarR family transcriptional regulator